MHYSLQAYLEVIADADKYKALLDTALDRAALRKVEAGQANTISKSAYPENFKDEVMWTEWEVKLEKIYPQSMGSMVCLCHILCSLR